MSYHVSNRTIPTVAHVSGGQMVGKRLHMGCIRPRGGPDLGTVPGGPERRQHGGSGLDVHGAWPGVAAGQFEGQMPHEFLDDPGRDPGRVGERRRLAPQGMEIEE